MPKKSSADGDGPARSRNNDVAEAKPSRARGPLAAAHKLVERTKRKDGQDLSAAQKESLFQDCEALVDKQLEGFVAVGIALRIIRDEELYREQQYDNFETYCKERWGFGRARASQLISAAGVVDDVYSCKQIDRLPSNEAQVRPLVKLGTEQRIVAWKRVVKMAKGDSPITAAIVEKAVARMTSTSAAQSNCASDDDDSEQAVVATVLGRTIEQLTDLLNDKLPGQIRDAALEELDPTAEQLKILRDQLDVCILQTEERCKLECKKRQASEDSAAA